MPWPMRGVEGVRNEHKRSLAAAGLETMGSGPLVGASRTRYAEDPGGGGGSNASMAAFSSYGTAELYISGVTPDQRVLRSRMVP